MPSAWMTFIIGTLEKDGPHAAVDALGDIFDAVDWTW